MNSFANQPQQDGSAVPDGSEKPSTRIALRFASHPAMGVITIVHPATGISVDLCLSPAVGLTERYPKHLNFIAMLTRGTKITEQEAHDAVGYAVDTVGTESLPIPVPKEGEAVVLPVAIRPGPELSVGEKLAGVHCLGAVICVPVTEECYQQNVTLLKLQSMALAAVTQLHSAESAAAGQAVH